MGLATSNRPVVLIVEDEFLLRMDAVDMIAVQGSKLWKLRMPTRPSKFWKLVTTSPWFSPISRCRVRWTG